MPERASLTRRSQASPRRANQQSYVSRCLHLAYLHLAVDIETIDALCDAINEYNGGVICVTHDARLIEATNMRLWVVENRQVTEWGEPFDAYRDHLLKTLEEAMAKEDQRVTAAGLSVDMGGNRN